MLQWASCLEAKMEELERECEELASSCEQLQRKLKERRDMCTKLETQVSKLLSLLDRARCWVGDDDLYKEIMHEMAGKSE
jgi:chromosome segregation ATPase